MIVTITDRFTFRGPLWKRWLVFRFVELLGWAATNQFLVREVDLLPRSGHETRIEVKLLWIRRRREP